VTDKTPICEPPVFSVIIAVYNDWDALDECLRALSAQTGAPSFEVILVDDGSTEPAPGTVGDISRGFPLAIIRQNHAGISAARNRGIQASHGDVLLFIDADCRVQPDCFAALASKLATTPQQSCFQLHLVGDCSNRVGRAEELRLMTLQNYLLRSDGRIRYLNTAGFAIRRAKAPEDGNLFSPVATRAEDTLLLANLMKRGELPVFVPEATVRHAVRLSLMECVRKDIRSAYVERKAFDLIAAQGLRIQLTNGDRLNILPAMWRSSGTDSIGRAAWFVVVGRQALRLVVSTLYRVMHRS